MQDVVAFMNGKGGVGKSALARTYAVERSRQRGQKVILADMNDGQYTSAKWAENRKRNGFEPEIDARMMTERQVFDLIGSPVMRPDCLVLDTAGWKDERSFKVANWSTFIVIPCGESLADDVYPTMEFALQLLQRGLKPWRFGVALSMFRDSTFEADAQAVRKAFGSDDDAPINVFAGVIRDMKSYSDALTIGRALTETTVRTLNDDAASLMSKINSKVRAAARELEGQELSKSNDRSTGRGR